MPLGITHTRFEQSQPEGDFVLVVYVLTDEYRSIFRHKQQPETDIHVLSVQSPAPATREQWVGIVAAMAYPLTYQVVCMTAAMSVSGRFCKEQALAT